MIIDLTMNLIISKPDDGFDYRYDYRSDDKFDNRSDDSSFDVSDDDGSFDDGTDLNKKYNSLLLKYFQLKKIQKKN